MSQAPNWLQRHGEPAHVFPANAAATGRATAVGHETSLLVIFGNATGPATRSSPPSSWCVPSVGEVLRANARYFFGVVADASCFVNLMVIDFFSPEPSFMNSVNV